MPRVIGVDEEGNVRPLVRHDEARDVIEWVIEHGVLGKLYLSPICETHAEAYELRKCIYRSAKTFCTCGDRNCTHKWGNIPGRNKENPKGGCPHGGMRASVQANVVKDADGKFRVEFLVQDKWDGIKKVIEKYGPDPNNWPYNPQAKRKKEK